MKNIIENIPTIALTVLICSGFGIAMMAIITTLVPPTDHEDIKSAWRYFKWMFATAMISFITLIISFSIH